MSADIKIYKHEGTNKNQTTAKPVPAPPNIREQLQVFRKFDFKFLVTG